MTPRLAFSGSPNRDFSFGAGRCSSGRVGRLRAAGPFGDIAVRRSRIGIPAVPPPRATVSRGPRGPRRRDGLIPESEQGAIECMIGLAFVGVSAGANRRLYRS